MAMSGLDKITDRILAQAQSRADKIIADAQAECDQISANYAARAKEIRDEMTAVAEKNGADRVARAKSTAMTNKRNLVLQTKSDLIDDVFDSTLEQIHNLETDKYAEFLSGLLSAAFFEQMEAERHARAFTSEEERVEIKVYEVLMNQRDRDRCGEAVVAGAKTKLEKKLSGDVLNKLKLSDKTVNIDGGLILRFGDVEANCSFALLLAELREKLETEVAHALFDVKKQS